MTIIKFILIVNSALIVKTSIMDQRVPIDRIHESIFKLQMPNIQISQKADLICLSWNIPLLELYIENIISISKENSLINQMEIYGCSYHFTDTKLWKSCTSPCLSSNTTLLYAWVNGEPFVQIPEESGIGIGKINNYESLVLRVQYRSTFYRNKYFDDSGFQLLLSNQRPKYSVGIFILTANQFVLKPKLKNAKVDIACIYNADIKIYPFAYRVHTHELGRIVAGYLFSNSSWHSIGEAYPQSKNIFYAVPEASVIKKSDILAARCSYDTSMLDIDTISGMSHGNEMCNFYVVYIANSSEFHDIPQICPSKTFNASSQFHQDLDRLQEKSLGMAAMNRLQESIESRQRNIPLQNPNESNNFAHQYQDYEGQDYLRYNPNNYQNYDYLENSRYAKHKVSAMSNEDSRRRGNAIWKQAIGRPDGHEGWVGRHKGNIHTHEEEIINGVRGDDSNDVVLSLGNRIPSHIPSTIPTVIKMLKSSSTVKPIEDLQQFKGGIYMEKSVMREVIKEKKFGSSNDRISGDSDFSGTSASVLILLIFIGPLAVITIVFVTIRLRKNGKCRIGHRAHNRRYTLVDVLTSSVGRSSKSGKGEKPLLGCKDEDGDISWRGGGRKKTLDDFHNLTDEQKKSDEEEEEYDSTTVAIPGQFSKLNFRA